MKSPQKVQKRKVVKAWAVLWEESVFPVYGINKSKLREHIVGCEIEQFLCDRIGVKRKDTSSFADFALFKDRKNAESYRKGNNEWKIVPVTISFSIPSKRK